MGKVANHLKAQPRTAQQAIQALLNSEYPSSCYSANSSERNDKEVWEAHRKHLLAEIRRVAMEWQA